MMFGAIEHSAWRHTIGKRPLDVQHMARTITDIFLNGLCPNSVKANVVMSKLVSDPRGGWPFRARADRQSRRDRVAHSAHGARRWDWKSVVVLSRCRCGCAGGRRRRPRHRDYRRDAGRGLSRRHPDHRRGARQRCGRDPSGLRLPVRERAFRPPGRRSRPRLCRPDRGSDRADGRQGAGPRLHRGARISGRAIRYRGRRSEDLCRARAGGRLSAADKTRRRRRRQGHAHRTRSGDARRRDRARAQRRRALFRRRQALCRVLCRAAAPYRGAGARRCHTAMSCICSIANARSSAASRRSSKRRRRRL